MKKSTSKNRVALYCRLSEEDKNKKNKDDDSASIQNQKSILLEHALRQGWDVYNIYSDDDYSGADRNRPAFKQMLADAEARKFDIILCKSQSRFTREVELVEKYIHGAFPLWGIRFVSIVDNADTNIASNKKARQLNGLFNQWQLEDMSTNIRSVLDNHRESGLHIGAFALYGYQKDPGQKGHLIIDEEAAEVVREVFALYAQGYGKTAIARMLNDRGVPNPTEYKRQKGLRVNTSDRPNSTLWSYSAIASMLTNEIYIGNMVQGKYGSISYLSKKNKPRPKEDWYIVENTHEPIIERALWNQVQDILSKRSKPFANGKLGLFAHKTTCALCGYTLRSSKSQGRQYLKCPCRHLSATACPGVFISTDRLEKMVLDELHKLCDHYLDQSELERNLEFNSDLKARKSKLQKQLNTCRGKSADCASALRNLYLDKVKGIISEADYLDFAKGFSEDKARYEQQSADAEQAIAELDARIAAGDNRKAIIEQYVHTDHLTREMVEALIDTIIVGKRIPGTRDVPIEIHWNF